MAKYINPFTDAGFKRIFGQEINKDLLINFLNELIQGDSPIVDIRFRDKEMFPQFYEGRRIVYDIYCTTQDGEHVIVEMQNASQPFFKDRSIFYTSAAIAQQGETGKEWNFDIKRVYGVFFLNFTIDNIHDWDLKSEVVLKFKESNEQFSDKLHLFYITLPKMTKREEECETNFEKWIYTLKNMETLDRMPFQAQNNIFGRLKEVADINSLNKKERQNYDESLKVYRDTCNTLLYAEQLGLEKGMQKGMEQGLQKGLQKGLQQGIEQGIEMHLATSVKNMHKMGFDDTIIATALNIPVNDIKKYL